MKFIRNEKAEEASHVRLTRVQAVLLAADAAAVVSALVVLKRLRGLHDQAWFWEERWLVGEREAAADIAAGRVQTFSSDAAFADALRNEHHRERAHRWRVSA